MRILLLFLGLPVLVAQSVADRVELQTGRFFVEMSRATQQARREAERVVPSSGLPLTLVAAVPAHVELELRAPDHVASRSLLFLKHRFRQAS